MNPLLKEAVQAEGDWIRSLKPWEFFITLTYKSRILMEEAERHYGDFLKRLAKHCEVHVFAATGGGRQQNGRPHHHALIASEWSERRFGPTRLTTEAIERMWKSGDPSVTGFSKIERYNPDEAAAHYLTQHEVSYQIACPRHLPCRRKTGCILGPSGL